MKTANHTYYIPQGDKLRKKSMAMANAMATELLHYGVDVDPNLIMRIASNKKETAFALCKDILKDYTVGKLNPPLFDEWEKRTYFSLGEYIVQIWGYIHQFSGNDLEDPHYMQDLLAKVK